MKGRDKCDLLNEIRHKIAEENSIEFDTEECTFDGNCTGTCPKCESEREYLDLELKKKQDAGEEINIRNIFALNDEPKDYNSDPIEVIEKLTEDSGEEDDALLGDLIFEERLTGDIPPQTDDEDDILLGDLIFEERLTGDIPPQTDDEDDELLGKLSFEEKLTGDIPAPADDEDDALSEEISITGAIPPSSLNDKNDD